MKEIWKPIKGYEGLYEVSNLGNIKSLSRKINDYRGKNARTIGEKILKQGIRNTYYIVQLHKEGIRKSHQVHRLVAEAFIPNLENKEIINHLDYNRLNNVVSNLEWCNQKENVQYSSERMKHKKSETKSNTGEKYITFRKTKGVYRVTIDKKEYGTCKSLNEAIKKRDEILKNG